MRVISLSVIFISVIAVFAFVNAFPTDNNDVRQNTLSDVYEITPDKTPDSVLSDETSTSRRVKRSDIIGFIRQICPPLANFISSTFEQVKKIVFKIVGRLLLGGNKKRPAGGQGKPAVIVNLPTYPPDEGDETTTEPVTDPDSSSSSDSTSSTESSSSSDSSSTKTSPSSESFSSNSSSPPSDNSLADTTSSTPETTSSTTESHSIGQTNSISTK